MLSLQHFQHGVSIGHGNVPMTTAFASGIFDVSVHLVFDLGPSGCFWVPATGTVFDRALLSAYFNTASDILTISSDAVMIIGLAIHVLSRPHSLAISRLYSLLDTFVLYKQLFLNIQTFVRMGKYPLFTRLSWLA